MIKAIVQKIMVKQFSKYIKGIEYNKLTIEVLGGFFSIENISLNHQYFNSLQLPVLVAFSHIGKLSIEAPLTKLSSVPVSCTIEDVYIIIQLKKHASHLSEVSKEELLQKYIRESFQLLVSKMKDANKEDGMLDRLGKKVIDNLKFQVKNIHIRFEEINQVHSYSFGISLESLTFGTTDKNWQPIFVQREKAKESEPIFKCMKIQNFKIYWQSIERNQVKQQMFLNRQTAKGKIQAMKKYVNIDQDSFLTINCMVKLKINPSSHFKVPLIELQINLNPINIKFSKRKIVEVLDFTTSCIKHNELMLKTLLDKSAKKTTHDQQTKMRPLCEYYTRTYLEKETAKGKKEKHEHSEVKEDFSYLFDNCRVEDLYQWCMGPIKEKMQVVREKQMKKEKKSWFSSTQVKLTPEEIKELEKLLNELTEQSISGKGRPKDSILLKLVLNLKGLYFHFYDENPKNKLKNIELSIEGISCLLQKSHDKSWFSIQNRIKRIVADLQLEQLGKVKKIQLMQNLKQENRDYLLQLVYRERVKVEKTTKVSYHIDMNLGKTLFTYKQEYWKMFKSFFSLPEINQQVQNQAFGKLDMLKGQSSDEDSEIVIEKFYNMQFNLMSPSFILPLSDTTCWYLDLGKISMRSQSLKQSMLYPFKLRQLNMRYIDAKDSKITSKFILSSQSYFPIIKDINIDVKVVTSTVEETIDFDVVLDKIELSATRQEFVNLLEVKKFLLGEEQDQIENLEEQRKGKQEVAGKAKLNAKVLKRRKYLHSWLQYCCFLSNNSIYLYKNEKELLPDSILSLRGAQLLKILAKEGQFSESHLEITVGSEITYLQFADEKTLNDWEEELQKSINELKNMDELLLQGGQVHKKKHRVKKQDKKRVNLQLRELSWNYLKTNGQSFMKIQLKNVNFKVNQREQLVDTIFQVGGLSIYDKVFDYKNKKYEHLLISQNLTINIEKTKEEKTKISPVLINVKLDSLDLNWKPDALLTFIQNVKEFLDIKPVPLNKDKSREEIVNTLRRDQKLTNRYNKYTKAGENYSAKDKRAQYLKMNAKDDQIYIKLKSKINKLKITFIHRQSHMPMFLMNCEELTANVSLGNSQKFYKGYLKTLDVYEIFGYPQKTYDINKEYKPFCLFQKKASSKQRNALEFQYSVYVPQQIPNKERVDSFMYLNFSPMTIHYFQEVTMRMIDYSLIQILLLLSKPEMITVNEDVLKQLLENRKSAEKPKYFIENEFQDVVMKYFQPFFMDYYIVFDSPEMIMSPTKDYSQYFVVNVDKVTINNKQTKSEKRFQRSDYEFKSLVYQEEIEVKGLNFLIYSINEKYKTGINPKGLDCDLTVNRLLFQDELTAISPEVSGYDRSIKVFNKLSDVDMPELSRVIYQNLVRLPNFNLTFQDAQEELFIHNYRITKTLSPKPIQYTMIIPQFSITAQHSIDENKEIKSKLCSFALKNFELKYNRDQKLNSVVQIDIESAESYVFEYEDLERFKGAQKKALMRINKTKNKNHCYFLVKMANTGKINVQVFIEQCQFFMNAAVLPLIADWVQVEDSVFPQSTQITRPIFVLARMPTIVVNLEDRTTENYGLKAVGEMTIEVSRSAGESQHFLKQGFGKDAIKAEYIEALKSFMDIRMAVGFQFFSRFGGRDRKLLDKVSIELNESNFYKVRNHNEFKKTYTRKLAMSELRGSIAIDDVLLFKCINDTLKQGQMYQKRYKEILQTSFSVALLQNQTSIYKDIFKEEKMLEEMTLKVQAIKFYFISKEGVEYIPIFKLFTNRIAINQFINSNNMVVNGSLNFGISYFNDQIFRWQPLIEPVQIRGNFMTTQNLQSAVQVEAINEINVNVSRENAVSVKKCIKTIESKLQLLREDKYKPDLAQQFVSRYIIKNQTGYPIEIFNEANVSMYIIMNGDQVNYTSKAVLACFFEENQLKETISFSILHPSQEFLPISAISLESMKSFDIDLHSAKGHKLPERSGLYLENQVKGCKKVLTIRSKKFISDYTLGKKVLKYYPFDQEDTVVLDNQQHKGFKANFFKLTKSQRFLYDGVYGHLVIRKQYLVYNYTMMPLNVSDYVVVPGQFVGINGKLKIQGMDQDQSDLKVVFNSRKKEYYIYSICYIIDYVGLSFNFQEDKKIKKLYSYVFKENNKQVVVYLLPDINTPFTVSAGKQSTKKALKGKLARENFQLTVDGSKHVYSCFSSLETFCEQNIKDFRKVIEITSAYIICNDTEEVITYRQSQSKERSKELPPNKKKVFHWGEKALKELLEISIWSGKEQWKYSSPLSIQETTQTFVIRSKTNESHRKILSLQVQETNNTTFIHIIDASKKIEILNSIPYSKITMYQTVVFQNKNVQLVNPENYIHSIGFKERQSFGYELPKHNHTVTVQVEFEQGHYDWRCPPFSIQDIENNLIEKKIDITNKKGEVSHRIIISLNFSHATKTVQIALKKRQTLRQAISTVVTCKLKAINLSLIGLHESIRKEIIICCFNQIGLNFYLNEKTLEARVEAKSIRIENTLKADPYFVALFRQSDQNDERPAFAFALKKSRTNARLIYYIGFSMRTSVLTVTSEQLQILEQNINSIMEKLDEKSDTNILLNFDSKFTPKKYRSDEKMYFSQAEIHPIRLILTYKHVNNWGGALLKALSLNDCKIKVDGKKINNFVSNDLLDFAVKIGGHFKQGFANELFSMIGSLALLGSPLNLASKIGCGFSNLINLPADGFQGQGVLGVGKGLALGTGSLISNTVEGAFGTVQSITGTIGNGISGLASYDKNFEKRRQAIKNQRVDHVGEGLLSGGKSIANGFFTGITGLVKEPIKGAEKGGIGGFFKGGLKGITGLVVKPVSGVIDATSKTAEGIKNTTNVFSKQRRQLRIRKYNPRPFYRSCRQIRNYDKQLAFLNTQLGCLRSRYQNMSWAGHFDLKTGQALAITYQYLLIIKKHPQLSIVMYYPASSLVSMHKDGEKMVLVFVEEGGKKDERKVEPKKAVECHGMLRNVYGYYHRKYQTGFYTPTPQ